MAMRTQTQLEIVISTVVIVMLIGTFAYHNLEGWGYIDSFYFTGITMTTIGYGDLYPTTAVAKIFTVFFAFGGVGISLFALSLIATSYFERRERIIMGDRLQKKLKRSLKNSENKRIRRKEKIIEGSMV
jgi:voltage-gated potassium channel